MRIDIMPKLTGPSVLGYRQIVGEAVGRFGEDRSAAMALKDLVIDSAEATAMKIAGEFYHLLYKRQYDLLVKQIAEAIREARKSK
jgi:hypothetical protein